MTLSQLIIRFWVPTGRELVKFFSEKLWGLYKITW